MNIISIAMYFYPEVLYK